MKNTLFKVLAEVQNLLVKAVKQALTACIGAKQIKTLTAIVATIALVGVTVGCENKKNKSNFIFVNKTMKTLLTSLLLLPCFVTICWAQKEIKPQNDFEGLTVFRLHDIPDSLKTTEQKELMVKLLRIIHTNIEFRGDSMAFLLDVDSFLNEGLPLSAYLEYKDFVIEINTLSRQFISACGGQLLLSEFALINEEYRTHFANNPFGYIPLLEFRTFMHPTKEFTTGPRARIEILSHDDVIFSADSLSTPQVENLLPARKMLDLKED